MNRHGSVVELQRLVLSSSENRYLGHVYLWRDTEDSHQIGHFYMIRTSIENYLLCRRGFGIKGIGMLLSNWITSWAKQEKLFSLSVQQPRSAMIHVLKNAGFVEDDKGFVFLFVLFFVHQKCF